MERRAALVLCLAFAACKGKSKPEPVVVGSVRLPAPIASSLPSDPRLVSAAVNPKGEAPYTGPTGTIGGIITVTGDEAPAMPEITAKIPADCETAKDTYGKLFREGPGRGLADVVVERLPVTSGLRARTQPGGNRRRHRLRMERTNLRAHFRTKPRRAQS